MMQQKSEYKTTMSSTISCNLLKLFLKINIWTYRSFWTHFICNFRRSHILFSEHWLRRINMYSSHSQQTCPLTSTFSAFKCSLMLQVIKRDVYVIGLYPGKCDAETKRGYMVAYSTCTYIHWLNWINVMHKITASTMQQQQQQLYRTNISHSNFSSCRSQRRLLQVCHQGISLLRYWRH